MMTLSASCAALAVPNMEAVVSGLLSSSCTGTERNDNQMDVVTWL